MKLIDKINDFMNSPVPNLKEELVKRNIGIQLRTNKQYDQEIKTERHEAAFFAITHLSAVIYAAVCFLHDKTKENAKWFKSRFWDLDNYIDYSLREIEPQFGNEIYHQIMHDLFIKDPEGHDITINEICDLVDNILEEDKNDEEENK